MVGPVTTSGTLQSRASTHGQQNKSQHNKKGAAFYLTVRDVPSLPSSRKNVTVAAGRAISNVRFASENSRSTGRT